MMVRKFSALLSVSACVLVPAALSAACGPAGAGACANDADCTGSDVCEGGACVECVSDRDCDDDERCEDGECERVDGDGDGSAGPQDSDASALVNQVCARWDDCDVPPPDEGTCTDNVQAVLDAIDSVDVTLCDELGDALRDAYACEINADCVDINAGDECPEEWEEITDLIEEGAGPCLEGEEPSDDEEEEPVDDVPAGWQCEPDYYGDGDCDCGCGVLDTDCGGAGCAASGCSVDTCDFCFEAGEFASCEEPVEPEPDCDVSAFLNPNGNGSLEILEATSSVSDENVAACPTATQFLTLIVSGTLQADLDGDEVSVSSFGGTPFSCGAPSLVEDVLVCLFCGGTSPATGLAVQLTGDNGVRTDAVCVEPE